MNLQRLVIAFIVASSAVVLVAGLWFKAPSFPAHGAAPPASAKNIAPDTEHPAATLAANR